MASVANGPTVPPATVTTPLAEGQPGQETQLSVSTLTLTLLSALLLVLTAAAWRCRPLQPAAAPAVQQLLPGPPARARRAGLVSVVMPLLMLTVGAVTLVALAHSPAGLHLDLKNVRTPYADVADVTLNVGPWSGAQLPKARPVTRNICTCTPTYIHTHAVARAGTHTWVWACGCVFVRLPSRVPVCVCVSVAAYVVCTCGAVQIGPAMAQRT